HLLRLLRSREQWNAPRAVLILFAFYKCEDNPLTLAVFLTAEALLVVLETRCRPDVCRRWRMILPLLCLLSWIPHGKTRTISQIVFWVLSGVYPDVIERSRALVARLAEWRRLLPAGAGVSLAFLVVLLTWPFEDWRTDPKHWSPLTRFHERLTDHLQVYP